MGSELQAVMAQMEAAGTAQNRKVYARHGAAEPMFGVSYADLGKIAKPIKTDHALAAELWDSGNHDARVLALRVADAASVDESLAERWLTGVDNYILAEGLGGLCARSPHARAAQRLLARPTQPSGTASTGWFIVTCTAEDPRCLVGRWTLREPPGSPDRGRDRPAAQSRPPRDERRADRHGAARRQSAPLGAGRGRPHRPGQGRPRPDRLQDPRRGAIRGAHSCSSSGQGSPSGREISAAPSRLAGRPLRWQRAPSAGGLASAVSTNVRRVEPARDRCHHRPNESNQRARGLLDRTLDAASTLAVPDQALLIARGLLDRALDAADVVAGGRGMVPGRAYSGGLDEAHHPAAMARIGL